MPNGDDGYGEFGGNGSVQWVVDVNDKIWTSDTGKQGPYPNGHRQSGSDRGANLQDAHFTISLEVPEGVDPREFAKRVANGWEQDGQKNRLKFEGLKIEKGNPDQIRISWPRFKETAK